MVEIPESTDMVWRRRIQWGGGLSFLAVTLTGVIFGPIDHTGEAVLLAILTLILGVFIGISKGRSMRRSVPYVGPGPRISQSTGGEDPMIYRSYDTTEALFEFTEPAVHVLALRALTGAPFVGDALAQKHGMPESGVEELPAVWLLQTQDSRGRPVFLDAPSLLGMISWCNLREATTTIDDLVSDLVRVNRLLVGVNELGSGEGRESNR